MQKTFLFTKTFSKIFFKAGISVYLGIITNGYRLFTLCIISPCSHYIKNNIDSIPMLFKIPCIFIRTFQNAWNNESTTDSILPKKHYIDKRCCSIFVVMTQAVPAALCVATHWTNCKTLAPTHTRKTPYGTFATNNKHWLRLYATFRNALFPCGENVHFLT